MTKKLYSKADRAGYWGFDILIDCGYGDYEIIIDFDNKTIVSNQSIRLANTEEHDAYDAKKWADWEKVKDSRWRIFRWSVERKFKDNVAKVGSFLRTHFKCFANR